MTDNDETNLIDLLNAFILYYNKYYNISTNLFDKIDMNNNLSTNHAMELFTEYMYEYIDKPKHVQNDIKEIDICDGYYELNIDENIFFSESLLSLLKKLTEEKKVYAKWELKYVDV